MRRRRVLLLGATGLVGSELLPLDKRSFLSMERSFSVGAPDTGNTIKLYTLELSGAKNINGRGSLAGQLGSIEPARKTLVRPSSFVT